MTLHVTKGNRSNQQTSASETDSLDDQTGNTKDTQGEHWMHHMVNVLNQRKRGARDWLKITPNLSKHQRLQGSPLWNLSEKNCRCSCVGLECVCTYQITSCQCQGPCVLTTELLWQMWLALKLISCSWKKAVHVSRSFLLYSDKHFYWEPCRCAIWTK